MKSDPNKGNLKFWVIVGMLLESEFKKKAYPYYFAWKNNTKRLSLYRRIFRIVAYGAKNSALVEFDNGQREIISRNAIRRNNGRSQICK